MEGRNRNNIRIGQEVEMGDGFKFKTTRCPIRIDGEILLSSKGTPGLGEHTNPILKEFNL